MRILIVLITASCLFNNVAVGGTNGYQVALASASYRASHGIKGHARHIERGRTTGVGWSSYSSQPNTCLGRGGKNYVVVRGRDGWYATKVR